MNTATTHLRLPYTFNVDDAQRAIMDIPSDLWISHHNQQDYDGRWSALSLYHISGDTANITVPTNSMGVCRPTCLLAAYPCFNKLIDWVQSDLIGARLMKLHAGAQIKPHKDYNMGYADGCMRVHIPIITHPKVEFVLDGRVVDMQEGECWYTNVNYTHSVVNASNIDRTHLVIDLVCNQWTDDLCFPLTDQESLLQSPEAEHSVSTIKSIIAELEHSDAPAAKGLIASLIEKINHSMDHPERNV